MKGVTYKTMQHRTAASTWLQNGTAQPKRYKMMRCVISFNYAL
jgi:hypothetical protein